MKSFVKALYGMLLQLCSGGRLQTSKTGLVASLFMVGYILSGIVLAPVIASASVLFSDVAERVGLDFKHFNGMTGAFYFQEMTGQGGALLDYDNDGDLDVYLLQGTLLGNDRMTQALSPPRGSGPLRDRLYRNDLQVTPDGSRRLAFVDVTETSGIRAMGYGMGIATGDFNNDGWVDLYVTNYGSNQMWRNNGDGTFTDVTRASGTDEARWSSSAAFVDYDRDGWLDLYITNYVHFDITKGIECYAPTSRRDYCGPAAFKPVADRLFRNLGDGTFADVTTRSGISAAEGPGLGVVTADVNNDGWIDIYVANDGQPNNLWINQRDGTFRDGALLAGIAVNVAGQSEASMGVDAGDFDADGDEDLFMVHLTGETNTLYVNDGNGFFEDRTIATGLAPGSLRFTGFGTAWFDYDNDGWLDLFIANGAVRIQQQLADRGDPYPLGQTNQLYHNTGGSGFKEVTNRAGDVFKLVEVSRGSAFGDVDNDGDTDILVFNNNGPARLLLNHIGNQQPWLGLRLIGHTINRDMLGARVAVHRVGAPTLWRRVGTDGSYCSANDPRVLLGVGADERVTAVQVYWPDGRREQWLNLPLGQYTTLRQGTGSDFK